MAEEDCDSANTDLSDNEEDCDSVDTDPSDSDEESDPLDSVDTNPSDSDDTESNAELRRHLKRPYTGDVYVGEQWFKYHREDVVSPKTPCFDDPGQQIADGGNWPYPQPVRVDTPLPKRIMEIDPLDIVS